MSNRDPEQHIQKIVLALQVSKDEVVRRAINLWVRTLRDKPDTRYAEQLVEHYEAGRPLMPTFYTFLLKLRAEDLRHETIRVDPDKDKGQVKGTSSERGTPVQLAVKRKKTSAVACIRKKQVALTPGDIAIGIALHDTLQLKKNEWCKKAGPLGAEIQQRLNAMTLLEAPQFFCALATWRKSPEAHRHAAFVAQVEALCTLAAQRADE